MIDATRNGTSLATALRDRPTGIPNQPNRSLPLRPPPPAPVRSALAKPPKKILPQTVDITTDALNSHPPENQKNSSSYRTNLEHEHSGTIGTKFYNSQCADADRSTEERMKNEEAATNVQGKRRSSNVDGPSCARKISKERNKSFEHRKEEHFGVKKKLNKSKSDCGLFESNRNLSEKDDLFVSRNWRTGEGATGVKGGQSSQNEDSRFRDESESNRATEKTVPPLKLKKMTQEKAAEPTVLPAINEASGSTNYRIITPASGSPSMEDVPTVLITKHTPQVYEISVRSENDVVMETFYTDGSPTAFNEHVSHFPNETGGTLGAANANECQTESSCVQISIPECPIAIPISMAQYYGNYVTSTPKSNRRTNGGESSKTESIELSNLPSMPMLEEDAVTRSTLTDVGLKVKSLATKIPEQSVEKRIFVSRGDAEKGSHPQQDELNATSLVGNNEILSRNSHKLLQHQQSTANKNRANDATYMTSDNPASQRIQQSAMCGFNRIREPIEIKISNERRIGQSSTVHECEGLDTEIMMQVVSKPSLSTEDRKDLQQLMKYCHDRNMTEMRIENVREEKHRNLHESVMVENRMPSKVEKDMLAETSARSRDDSSGNKLHHVQQFDLRGQRQSIGENQTNISVIQENRQNSQHGANILEKYLQGQGVMQQQKNVDTARASRTGIINTELDILSNVAVKSAHRSDEEKMKSRFQKLNVKLLKLQKIASNLKRKIAQTDDLSQRKRLQQMINCNEKQVENITKHLSKLTAAEQARSIRQRSQSEKSRIKVRQDLVQETPSPELSPGLPTNCINIRSSPPGLPKVNITIPLDLITAHGTEEVPKNMRTVREPDNSPRSPLFEASSKADNAAQMEITRVVDVTNDPEIERNQGGNELEKGLKTSPSRMHECLKAALNARSLIHNDLESRASDTQACSQVLEVVDLTVKRTANYQHSQNGSQQERDMNHNVSKPIVTLDDTIEERHSVLPRFSAGSTNVRAGIRTSLENNDHAIRHQVTNRTTNVIVAPQASNILHNTSNSSFNQPIYPIDYRRVGNTQNGLSRDSGGANISSKSPLQGYSALAIPGTYHQPSEAQVYTSASEADLGYKMAKKSNQASEVEATMDLRIDRDELQKHPSSVSQLRQLVMQPPKRSLEESRSIRPAKTIRNSVQADQSNYHDNYNNVSILSEHFPTLSHYAAQIKNSTLSTARTNPAVAPQPNITNQPDYRVPGSDMYKMSATAVDTRQMNPLSVNNISPHWRADRPWHDQNSLHQGFYGQSNMPQLYPEDYQLGNYTAAMAYQSMYAAAQYHQLQRGPLPGHHSQLSPPGSMNSRASQLPASHSLIQSAQNYTSAMLTRSAGLPVSFRNRMSPSTAINGVPPPEYPHSNHLSSSNASSHIPNILHPGYHQAQFQIPSLPSAAQSAQQPGNGPYRVNGHYPRSKQSEDLSVRLMGPGRFAAQGLVRDSSIKSSNASPQVQWSGGTRNTTRDCGTPYLGRAEHSPNTLSHLRCSNCGVASPGFNCLGCETAFYCGLPCQVQHWVTHEAVCPKRMPKLKKVM